MEGWDAVAWHYVQRAFVSDHELGGVSWGIPPSSPPPSCVHPQKPPLEISRGSSQTFIRVPPPYPPFLISYTDIQFICSFFNFLFFSSISVRRHMDEGMDTSMQINTSSCFLFLKTNKIFNGAFVSYSWFKIFHLLTKTRINFLYTTGPLQFKEKIKFMVMLWTCFPLKI